jgi:hypothetical protein
VRDGYGNTSSIRLISNAESQKQPYLKITVPISQDTSIPHHYEREATRSPPISPILRILQGYSHYFTSSATITVAGLLFTLHIHINNAASFPTAMTLTWLIDGEESTGRDFGQLWSRESTWSRSGGWSLCPWNIWNKGREYGGRYWWPLSW